MPLRTGRCRGAPCRAYDPGVSDFSTRPMTLDDASAVNDLLAAAEAVDRTGEHYYVDDVLEELDNPMIDLGQGLAGGGARRAGRRPLAAAAACAGRRRVSVSIDGTVHPDHRRTGIGSHVVPLMVARAHEYVAGAGPRGRWSPAARRPTNTDLESVFREVGLRPSAGSS